MIEYLKEYWKLLSLSAFACGFLVYFGSSKKPEKVKVPIERVKIEKPKSDSVIAVIDSVLELKKKIELEKEISFKKKEALLEKQLKIEKSKKPKKIKEKTKVIIQTKEVIVEKEVRVQDPNTRDVIVENYNIQEENKNLKKEIESLKKSYKTQKDSISTDTIKSKRKRFLLF